MRPWLNLDEHEARGQRGPRLYREWWIHFHIDNDDQRSRRLKSTFDLDSTASVFDLMKALKDWHSEWWAKQPGEHPIVIDMVVDCQKVWKSKTQLSYESLNIYIPPSYSAVVYIASL